MRCWCGRSSRRAASRRCGVAARRRRRPPPLRRPGAAVPGARGHAARSTGSALDEPPFELSPGPARLEVATGLRIGLTEGGRAAVALRPRAVRAFSAARCVLDRSGEALPGRGSRPGRARLVSDLAARPAADAHVEVQPGEPSPARARAAARRAAGSTPCSERSGARASPCRAPTRVPRAGSCLTTTSEPLAGPRRPVDDCSRQRLALQSRLCGSERLADDVRDVDLVRLAVGEGQRRRPAVERQLHRAPADAVVALQDAAAIDHADRAGVPGRRRTGTISGGAFR